IQDFISSLRTIVKSGPLSGKVFSAIQSFLEDLKNTENPGTSLDSTIGTIDQHLSELVLDKHACELFIVPDWIRAGEWLLRLGIIQACHKRGRSDAERTFQRVVDSDDVMAPFALFYLACFSMKSFEDMRKRQTSLILVDNSRRFVEDFDRAMELFSRARVAFLDQLERRKSEVQGIQQRSQGLRSSECGLQLQVRELESAIKQIVANIDWLIGEPMSAAAFHPLVADQSYQRRLFESLTSIDVIAAPTLDIKSHITVGYHHRTILRKFGLSRAQIFEALNNCIVTSNANEPNSTFEHEDEPNSTSEHEAKGCLLPTRIDFWEDMIELEAFKDNHYVYVIEDDSMNAVRSSIPASIPSVIIDMDRARTSIRYSNQPVRDVVYYTKSAIDGLIDANADRTLADTVQDLLNRGCLRLDILARIDISKLRERDLIQFDGFTPLQLKEHFDMDEATCSWILNRLSSHGIIELRLLPVVQLAPQWREHAANFDWTSSGAPAIKINEDTLKCLANLEQVCTISAEILCHVMDCLRNQMTVAQELYDVLLQEGLLRRLELPFYRQGTHPARLDCSMLPRTLQAPIQHFFARSFAYSFARDVLISGIADSKDDPYTLKEVMLPAHQELFDELCRLDVISPPRIVSDHYKLIDYSDFEFVSERDLSRFIHSRRLKLRDAIQMFELVPFPLVLVETGAVSNTEMESLIDIGMAAGVSLKKVSNTKKIAGALYGFSKIIVNNGLLLVKGLSGLIGMLLG
ncbi:hypothetical protein PMAYCL1PPCAC_09385, partial [Pristionchus mayeri]